MLLIDIWMMHAWVVPGFECSWGVFAPECPELGGRTGGMSGPAVRAVALAQVAAVRALTDLPIVGMGGVQTGRHARDLLDAGATVVAVGTESFRDPLAGARIT